jgi:class 3 adenylate cyclase
MTILETAPEVDPAFRRRGGALQPEVCPTCGAAMPEDFRFCGQCGRALAATLAPAPGDLVTILFTDLQGYTSFASRHDDAAVRELVLDYHALVREQVDRHGGFEVKQTGDGFMIAFASAARAVRCAADVQRAALAHDSAHLGRKLGVCVGLNSGDAIREGDDFFGHTVNIASRIAGRASGGQILASEATRVLAGRVEGVHFRDIGRRQLRGVQARQRLFEVVWGTRAED